MSTANRDPRSVVPLKQDVPDLEIRSLRPSDTSELSYLEAQIFRFPWSENSLRDCLEQATVEGEAALIEGKIVGYLIVQCILDEAHILNLAVYSPFRRYGIARKLLERFLTDAQKRKINLFYLEVRAGNRDAQRLYFGYGFAPISVRKKYYPDGEDALILMKRL